MCSARAVERALQLLGISARLQVPEGSQYVPRVALTRSEMRRLIAHAKERRRKRVRSNLS